MPSRESVPAEGGSPAGPPPEVAVEEADTTEEQTTETEATPQAVHVDTVEGDLHVHYHVDGGDVPADASDGEPTRVSGFVRTAIARCLGTLREHVRLFAAVALVLAAIAAAMAVFPLSVVLNAATIAGLVLNVVSLLAKTSPDDAEDDQ